MTVSGPSSGGIRFLGNASRRVRRRPPVAISNSNRPPSRPTSQRGLRNVKRSARRLCVAGSRRPRFLWHAGKPCLLNSALALYISTMIAVKAENGRLQVTIPTEGMTPDEVNDFVSWLRVESVVRRSRLTPEAAWKLSEDIKSDWWQANERGVTPEGAE